jgi:NAD(P) transhydrogenase
MATTVTNNNSYDLVVIGSGPAGQKAAICAAKMRKKVAIIERKRCIGGVCVNAGTIPSKTFREAVLYLSGLRQRTFYGRGYAVKDQIAMQDLVFRSDAVMAREIEVIKSQLRRNRVTVLEGNARFVSDHTMEVQGDLGTTVVRGDYFVIACGPGRLTTSKFPSMANEFSTPTRYTICRSCRAN